MTNQDDIPPVAWLLNEIKRRFGAEAADDLHRAYNEQTQRYDHRRRLVEYQAEIAQLEARLDLAVRRGEDEAFIRRLEKKIAHRRQRCADGWPDNAPDNA